MTLTRALADFWGTDELRTLAARRVDGDVAKVVFYDCSCALAIQCGARSVLEVKLEMTSMAFPDDEVWWSTQLSAAYAILKSASEREWRP